MIIGEREIGNGNPTYIIAEAGTNHFGDVERAKELVTVAAECGADAIKFQAFVKDAPLFCPVEGDDERMPYWNDTVLGYDGWLGVSRRAHDAGIHFILSVFQDEAMRLLKLCDAAKVASRAAMTFPYDETDLPLIVSNGMMERGDWIKIGPLIKGRECQFLSCVAKYPAPLSEALTSDYRHRITQMGLSDHSGTIWPSLYAISHGCPMVEVHFRDARGKKSRDHAVEILPDQLKVICDYRDAVQEMTS